MAQKVEAHEMMEYYVDIKMDVMMKISKNCFFM